MPRTIRERPRYALLLGLGLACLVAIGLLAGLLLAGGDDSTDATPDVEARELRATRADLEDAQARLDSVQSESERAADAAARQRARAQAWRLRALRAERRSRALRRELAQAQQE